MRLCDSYNTRGTNYLGQRATGVAQIFPTDLFPKSIPRSVHKTKKIDCAFSHVKTAVHLSEDILDS